MRVALVNSLFPDRGIGGSEMSTLFLAQGLQSLGHNVRVFSENDSNETVDEVYKGIEVLRIASPPGFGPNIFDSPRLQRVHQRDVDAPVVPVSKRLGEHILNFRPNVIHTAVIGDVMGFWRLANSIGVPAVHTLRSYSLMCSRRMLRGDVPCARQCLECLTPPRRSARESSSMVTGVVAISSHVMDVFSGAGWFADTQHRAIIHNSYEAAPASDVGVKAEPEFEFGYIGRIHETKGVEQFLQAVTSLNATGGKPARVLVAGDGNPHYVDKLTRRYSSDAIHFGGYMMQEEFFRRIKYCVVPSIWYEPFGRVFIESLHHGVPVLGSRRGGGSEVLSKDTGWLFDPGAPEEMLGALLAARQTADDRYSGMRDACITASSNYSVTAIASRYADFYMSCLGVPR